MSARDLARNADTSLCIPARIESCLASSSNYTTSWSFFRPFPNDWFQHTLKIYHKTKHYLKHLTSIYKPQLNFERIKPLITKEYINQKHTLHMWRILENTKMITCCKKIVSLMNTWFTFPFFTCRLSNGRNSSTAPHRQQSHTAKLSFKLFPNFLEQQQNFESAFFWPLNLYLKIYWQTLSCSHD